MNGIVIVDKPSKMTSRCVVNEVSKIFNTKKVGHTGTLDPLATGVLVICVNKATKLVERLTFNDKEYVATCLLGLETDTLDIEGKVLKEEESIVKKEDIIDTLNSFIKTYNQEVPVYSAVKVNGKKLYQYARENININLPSRSVSIYDIRLIDEPIYKDGKTEFKFLCHVSKGTYIRSLIRDIAKKLNTVGTMTSLRRTRQGKYKIDTSYTLDSININSIIPIRDVLGIKEIELTSDIEKKVLNGAEIDNIYDEKEILFIKNNKEIALYKACGNEKLKIDKMF